ncbi:hypothetical protein [Thiobacter aerophilum]|uniref:DUF4412 domain-containing protein n=1 Tax=Thiobacter aerophilum TaxID=3121275 RepID=A0ABV0EJI6_9BURK
MRGLAALLLMAATLAARAEGMVEVSFMDQPPDGGGYVTRYLVTDRYLRMDYGQDRDDFLLFDRQAKLAYNVTHDQRTILVIEPGPVAVARPAQWEVKEDLLSDERGRRTFDITVNGQHCSRITASPTFLPEVVQALAEFNAIMTASQSVTYQATPPELRQPCDLARFVFDHGAWLKNGLPLYEADADGSVRRLLSYETGLPERRLLFALPNQYRTVRLKDLQGAARP